jgi:toxin ParE1/3/4
MEPAVEDLDRIADYISLDDPDAAVALVRRVYAHVGQLAQHGLSGSVIPELRKSTSVYRQIVEPPLRIFYRIENEKIFVLHVIRGEQRFSRRRLESRVK